MPYEVLEALRALAEFCLSQNSCSDCPMKDCCGKLPSEYVDLV